MLGLKLVHVRKSSPRTEQLALSGVWMLMCKLLPFSRWCAGMWPINWLFSFMGQLQSWLKTFVKRQAYCILTPSTHFPKNSILLVLCSEDMEIIHHKILFWWNDWTPELRWFLHVVMTYKLFLYYWPICAECREYTGHWWILLTKCQWCRLW